MIIVDAAAAVHLFVSRDDRGRWLADRMEGADTLHVPALFDLEVLQSLRGLEASGGVPAEVVTVGLVGLTALRATRHDHLLLRSRVWALRHNLTAYDAAYVALAEALDSPLVTTDERLARSSGHGATIELPPV